MFSATASETPRDRFTPLSSCLRPSCVLRKLFAWLNTSVEHELSKKSSVFLKVIVPGAIRAFVPIFGFTMAPTPTATCNICIAVSSLQWCTWSFMFTTAFWNPLSSCASEHPTGQSSFSSLRISLKWSNEDLTTNHDTPLLNPLCNRQSLPPVTEPNVWRRTSINATVQQWLGMCVLLSNNIKPSTYLLAELTHATGSNISTSLCQVILPIPSCCATYKITLIIGDR